MSRNSLIGKKGKLKKQSNLMETSILDTLDVPQMDSTTGRKRRVFPGVSRTSSVILDDTQRLYSVENRSDSDYFDDYGFRITAHEKLAESNYKRLHEPSQEYVERWIYILNHWDQVSPKKKKKYCRMGIPQSMRGKAWQLLLGTLNAQKTSEKQGVYATLRSKPLVSEKIADIIERDLGRTFPTQIMFEDGGVKNGKGILRNILYAYANYNTLVGYCQGMNFLVATLLLQMDDEESTFWAFCALMERPPYQMESLYEPGFPQLHCCFYVFEKLLKQQNKKVYKRLKELEVECVYFANHWFLTAFTYQFNFGLISRIWDMFLCEGWKPIYRIALALLSMEKARLLAQHSDLDMLMALSAIQEGKDPDELLKHALSIKFLTKKVYKCIQKFRNQ